MYDVSIARLTPIIKLFFFFYLIYNVIVSNKTVKFKLINCYHKLLTQIIFLHIFLIFSLSSHCC